MTDKNGVGLTVVSHASANRMLVDCYEPAGCLSGSIVTSVQQLVKLADISAHCEHFIQYECPDSQLLNGPGSIGYMHDWWVLRDGKAMTYWGGGIILLTSINAWRLNRSCADPRYGCNCDINDYVWRENRELLTNQAELPVIQLRFGDTGEARDDERGYHPLETEVLWHKLRVLQVTLRQILLLYS